jgi:hypothetical protein
MYNAEILAAFGHTRHRMKTNKTQKHNATQKPKKMSNTYSSQNRG